MSDIINEIKEAINQERMETFFKKYLPYLVGGAIIFITTFGAGLWYKHYTTNKIYKDGGEYISAINKIRAQNLDEGLKKFEDISKHDSNYAALANFNLASYAIFNKKALYIYIREIIDVKTPKITKIADCCYSLF